MWLMIVMSFIVASVALHLGGKLSPRVLIYFVIIETLIIVGFVAYIAISAVRLARDPETHLHPDAPLLHAVELRMADTVPSIIGRPLMVETRGVAAIIAILSGRSSRRNNASHLGVQHKIVRAQYDKPALTAFLLAALANIPILVMGRIALPPGTFRTFLEICGVLGTLWLLMLCASLRHYTHEFGPEHVRVSFANLHDFWLPSRARSLDHYAFSSGDGRLALVDGLLTVPVGNRTNLLVELADPVLLRSNDPRFDGKVVTRVRVWADEPHIVLDKMVELTQWSPE